jgi:hypothetical protein
MACCNEAMTFQFDCIDRFTDQLPHTSYVKIDTNGKSPLCYFSTLLISHSIPSAVNCKLYCRINSRSAAAYPSTELASFNIIYSCPTYGSAWLYLSSCIVQAISFTLKGNESILISMKVRLLTKSYFAIGCVRWRARLPYQMP